MPKSADFILQPHLFSVVLVEPYGPSFDATLERLKEEPVLQVVECVSAMDALSVVRQLGACVILAHAATPHDVAQHLTLLKMLAPQIQTRKNVRMIMTVSASLSAEQQEKLTIHGCSELIPDSTPAKALLFKLDRHIKALFQSETAEPSVGDVVRVQSAAGRGEKAAAAAAAPVEIPAGVRLGPALSLPQDCWCLAGGGARRASGKWRVKVRGPAPDVGRWVTTDKADLWRWLPSEGDGAAASSQIRTGWFFGGEQRPEYHRGFWTFTSENPWLGFLDNDNAVGHKFGLSEKGSLVVARDSEAALSLFQAAQGEASRESAYEAAPNSEARVVYVDPLELASDFWVMGKFAPKRVAERWLIQAMGPGPAVGRWVPHERRKRKTESGEATPHWEDSLEKWWRWEPELGERDPFHHERGHWHFYGLQPNFSSGSWSFASSAPELGFYFKGECRGDRFHLLEDGALEVARDSDAALGALGAIKASFDRAVTPKPESEEAPLQDESEPALGPIGEPSLEEEEPRVDQESGAEAGTGAKTISTGEPDRPALSALALMYAASEIIASRGVGQRARCDRYCAFLKQSLGGLHVELWTEAPGGGWACVGSSDRGPGDRGAGRYGARAGAGAGLSTQGDLPVRSVEVRPSLQNPVGMLMIGGLGARRVDPAYAEVAARAAVGLVLGARAQVRAEPDSDLKAA